MSTPLVSTLLASLALSLSASALAAPPLTLDAYNPGHEAIFPVSSVLVTGEHESLLIDAQFGKGQAEKLVEKVKRSGKPLKRIYISHSDPDYYFGLDTLVDAFPDVEVLASAPTVEHIQHTMKDKLADWGPKLGADAPRRLIVPKVLKGNRLELEGQALEVVGLDGPQPDRSFVWIPSLKAVVGGVVLANNQHVWMADTQSAQSHQDWLGTLARIESLKPSVIVPGHALPGPRTSAESPTFTAGYIRAFDQEAARSQDANALIEAMKTRYPDLGEVSSLELSAKVAKGEMAW